MSTFYRITDGTLHELDVELVEGMAESKREILRLGEAIITDNATRLTSCLVLATEAPGEPEATA